MCIRDRSSAPFPVSLTTTVFIQRSTRWFGTSRRRAVPKGLPSSLAQHRIKKPRLHDQTPLYVRGTPGVLDPDCQGPRNNRLQGDDPPHQPSLHHSCQGTERRLERLSPCRTAATSATDLGQA